MPEAQKRCGGFCYTLENPIHSRRFPPAMLLAVVLLALWSGAVFTAVPASGAPPSSELPSFELDVQPILTARGCNSGPCHGKARGQNGFKLSLFAYDSEFDFAAVTRHGRGRRIFPASPQRSLLLRKATGEVPHGGGVRLKPGGRDYAILERWIQAGCPRRLADEPIVERIELTPREFVGKPGSSLQLRVVAHYSNGTTRDVTRWTTFQSSEPVLAQVDHGSLDDDDSVGTLRLGKLPGEATVMARFMNDLATCRVAIPLSPAVPSARYRELPRANFIDEHVWRKLATLNILPAERCDDATFLRRASIDLIGRLPTAAEAREFLESSHPDKRRHLVSSLLERPEYADHWATMWVDLLRPNPYRVGIKAVYTYDEWIRRQFRQNRPYDEMVRDLLTARGSTWHNGATTLFRDRRTPEELTALVSQLFLGIRLECAKCHHHPFERWSQHDYYSFAAFFGELARKGTGLSPPISGSEEFIYDQERTVTAVRHPVTGDRLAARPLFGEIPRSATERRLREQLAAWLTSRDNSYFARVIVNRVWAQLMGIGLVDPVDDLRATNPPSNPRLLDALAADFAEHHYDLKHLLRTITSSHVYQLSSATNATNAIDNRNYSRHYRQRLKAEVLLQAITDITEVEERFSAMPLGSGPHELWTHRIPSVFLDTFGRPDPNQDPPCERLPGTTVTQTLHLMNSRQLHKKIAGSNGRIARLLTDSQMTATTLVEELYLACYSRLPTDDELKLLLPRFPRDRNTWSEPAQDLLWALLNTPEFLFKN